MTATATKKAPAKKEAVKKSRTTKLRKPLRQVLSTLTKAKGPMSRRTIAEKVAKNDNLIEGRIAAETLTYGELVQRKLVIEKEVDVEGKKETCYTITAAGTAALAAAK